MNILEQIKEIIAKSKATPETATEAKDSILSEVTFSNEITPVAAAAAPVAEEKKAPADAPVADEAKKEEVKAATPEERLAALESAVEEIKAAITEIANAMGGAEAEKAEMAEIKKENKVLAKKVKELSDAPAVPSLNFARVEASAVAEIEKTQIVKSESIRDMVKRMTAK